MGWRELKEKKVREGRGRRRERKGGEERRWRRRKGETEEGMKGERAE